MAKRKAPKVITATPAASAPASDGADDLAVLNPDRAVTIAGREITVREYGFVRGLELAPLYTPFVDELHDRCAADGKVPELNEIVSLLGKHHQAIEELVAASAEVELEWVRGLSDQEGMRLLYTWWAVLSPFFIRRVFDRISGDKVAAAVKARHAGATSTPS